ncbi:MAG: HAMP domain-containing histidine kinase, partial [Bacteroidales bacterium]|nr:HAMP domain-containing histidine kinase [Bacteroidales bacterium]
SETELKESNATKDKLFSIIAHDLRSPLSTLMGFTELLIRNFEKIETKKQKEIIGLINKSTNDTYKLLENLLTWALAQRGLIHYNQDHVNLEVLIKENILLLENTALEKEISIVNKAGKDIVVKADRQMVSTILRNLLTNAIKFTPVKGQIEITAKILPGEKPKSAEICVSDNGIGMDAGKIAGLFKPESHFSEAGTAAEKGTGLGLIICKEFIEKNGGAINVQSESGKGSKFTFTLEAV